MTRKWFEASLDKDTLGIWDFDGTIADVPERPKTDKEAKEFGWNGKDWWGSECSLSRGVTPIVEVINAMHLANKPNIHLAVLTGRRGVVAHAVRRFLREQGFSGMRVIPESSKDALKAFKSLVKGKRDIISDIITHYEYFTGDFSYEEDFPKTSKGKPDGATLAHKRYIIEKLMHKGIKSIHNWDDRDDHVRAFIQLGLDLQKTYPSLEEVILHKVYKTSPGQQPHIQEIPVRPGMNY